MSGKVKYFYKRKCVFESLLILCIHFRRKASDDIVIGASKTSTTRKHAVKKEGNAILKNVNENAERNAEICPQFTAYVKVH